MINKKAFLFLIFSLISSFTFADSTTAIVDSIPLEVEGLIEDSPCFKSNKRISDNRLRKLIEKSRRCTKNSDCTTLFTGDLQSPFRCQYIHLREDKVGVVLDAIYLNECNHLGSCYLGDRCKGATATGFCNKGRCQ